MKKINSKYYKFAGLDFIFDEDENPWFVEANFSSHGLPYIEKTNHKVIKKLIKLLKKNGDNVCYLVGKKRKNTYGSSKWVYDFLKTQMNLHYGYFEDNKKIKDSIITKDKNEIKPSTIFAYNALNLPLHILRLFPNKFLNHPKMIELITNKYKLYKIIKNSKVLVPKTYLVKSKKDISKILEKNKLHNGFVIKPMKGTYGYHVHVFAHDKYKPNIKKKMIIQQRIIPKKRRGKFWDVRVYVLDGEYVGCFVRESKKRVTNIKRGAKTAVLPKRLERKLVNPSLEIVRLIEKEGRRYI